MIALSDTVPSYARTAPTLDTPEWVAADTRPVTAELQIDIVDTLEALDDIGENWTALFEQHGCPHQVFQTFGFAQVWVRSYLASHSAHASGRCDCTCRLAIITARQGGRLVLVWPMVLQSQYGLRLLTWLGEPVAQYGDILVDRSCDTGLILEAALAHARRELRPSALRLRKVRADAAIAPFLHRLGGVSSERTEAPCITLAAGGSSVDSRQSGKAKKNRRRLLRRLEEQGAVEFIDAAANDKAASLAHDGIASKRAWLLARGHASPALGDPRFERFFAAAAGEPNTTGCRTFAMTLAGAPVAIAIGFQCKRRLMLHLIAHSADVERYGAGVLNLEAILHRVETEGLEALDLLPPKADYKLDWADRSVEVADRAIGLTPAGRAFVQGYDGLARPLVKRALERLPLSLRRALTRRSLSAIAPD